MSKIILTTICLFLLFSCKKEQDLPKIEGEKDTRHLVRLNVSGFKLSVGEISSTGFPKLVSAVTNPDSLKKHMQVLYWVVYDSEGKEVSRMIQNDTGNISKLNYDKLDEAAWLAYDDVGKAAFGSITDSLEAGTYTGVLIGSPRHNAIAINTFSQLFENRVVVAPLTSANFLFHQIDEFELMLNTEDVFFKKIRFTVGGSDYQQSVTLDRIVGKLEINLMDAIPQNAKNLKFTIEKEGLGYAFMNEGPADLVNFDIEIPIKDSEKGLSGYRYEQLIINTSIPLKITIAAYDSSNSLIAQKELDSVRVYKNKRTILKGNLFDAQLNAGFNVQVNSAWLPDTEEISF